MLLIAHLEVHQECQPNNPVKNDKSMASFLSQLSQKSRQHTFASYQELYGPTILRGMESKV